MVVHCICVPYVAYIATCCTYTLGLRFDVSFPGKDKRPPLKLVPSKVSARIATKKEAPSEEESSQPLKEIQPQLPVKEGTKQTSVLSFFQKS